MLYDLATPEQQSILREQYDVAPFPVQTITLERIFIDKLFAAEAYVRKAAEPHRAFEAAKHIYDLAALENCPPIRALLADDGQMERLLAIRMEEEQRRLDGIPNITPNEFVFFTQAAQSGEVQRAYALMQRQYVLQEQNRIPFEAAMQALKRLGNALAGNTAWESCKAPVPHKEKK